MDEFGTGLRVSVIRRTLVVTALVSFNAFVLFPAFLGARTWLFPEIGLDWVFLPVGFACMCALACPGGITRIGGCLFLLAPIIVLVAIQTGQLWVAHLSFLPFYFALLGALRFHAVMMSSLQMQLEMTLACGGISRLPFANTGDLIIFFCYVFVTNLLPFSGIAYAYGMRIWNRKICVAFVVWILYNCTTAIQSFFLPGFPPYLLIALPILFGCLAIVISLEMFLNWRRLETLSFFNPGTGLDSRELQQLRSTVSEPGGRVRRQGPPIGLFVCLCGACVAVCVCRFCTTQQRSDATSAQSARYLRWGAPRTAQQKKHSLSLPPSLPPSLCPFPFLCLPAGPHLCGSDGDVSAQLPAPVPHGLHQPLAAAKGHLPQLQYERQVQRATLRRRRQQRTDRRPGRPAAPVHPRGVPQRRQIPGGHPRHPWHSSDGGGGGRRRLQRLW